MNIFTITANGKSKKDVKIPSGRYDVNIEQWSKAQEHLNTALKANDLFEEGKLEESQKLAVESMCGTMSALSIGLEMDDLLRMDMDKVNNLFMMQFAWLQNETPKRKFKIKGKKFEIPNFGERSCGDFVDTMSLLSIYEDYQDADKGIIIEDKSNPEKNLSHEFKSNEIFKASDLPEIEERIEFLKKYGRMDLFYSCAFFLLNSMRSHKINMQPHLALKAEMEKLTSTLNAWASTLYLQTLQNQTYFRTP